MSAFGKGRIKPVISTSSLPDAYVGEPYSAQIQARGTAPLNYSISALALANGLTCDFKTGKITGTPKTARTIQGVLTVNQTLTREV